ncbi:MAG: M1 family metallopeptidase [Bacteroidetes bacterium]|nr:M1 family metallopeptidase [Bacteroidota bacterium]
MKRILVICLLLFAQLLSAQNPNAKKYFQQEVHYTISVKLDDANHILRAYEELEYINNSPDTLREIYMHLWPNAYKNNKTAYAKQTLQEGKTNFYYAPKAKRGFIDSLDFKVDGETAKWELTKKNIDIAILHLNKPLLPNQKIKITTPFKVKVPSVFSRMGHDGQSYQISQWYPKPAVYDRNGWNPIPYLDMGEFYSEYGSFDVSITLPDNYVVAATGRLQNPAEVAWLNKLAEEGRKYKGDKTKTPPPPFPLSSTTFKTIRYVQDSVHDFAWFADKRFMVLKKDTTLPTSKRVVSCYAMFTKNQWNQWQNADNYVARSVQHYSKYVGEYPYTAATAVSGSLLDEAGGMEYPMVTNISAKSEIETVILHEVGHNWFYGIFGSNERYHGWMDEGINSYYEALYVEKNETLKSYFKESKNHLRFSTGTEMLTALAAYYYERIGLGQPIDIPSQEFTTLNYGLMMYGKTSRIIQMMRYNIGEQKFDSIMLLYFETWKFKHPQPDDFINFFQTASGQNMDWVDDMLKTNKPLDYTITKANKNGELTLKRKGLINAPVLVAGGDEKGILSTQFFFNEKREFKIRLSKGKYDYFLINPFPIVPEINYTNNSYYIKPYLGRFKPPVFKPFFALENNRRTNIFYSPVIAWNFVNGWMGGLALYNDIVTPRKISFRVIAMSAVNSFSTWERKSITGFADIHYTDIPYCSRYNDRITIGTNLKSYGFFPFVPLQGEGYSYYSRWKIYLDYSFTNKNKRDGLRHDLSFSANYLNYEYVAPDNTHVHEADSTGNLKFESFVKMGEHWFNNFDYHVSKGNKIIGGDLHFHFQNALLAFNKASINFNYQCPLPIAKKEIYFSGFFGSFIGDFKGGIKYNFPLGGTTGLFDYTVDEWYLDRSGTSSFYGKQIYNNGGFKFISDSFTTKKWLSTLSVSVTAWKGFRIYADAGIMPNNLGYVKPYYSAGLSFVVLKDYLSVYFPIVYSPELSKALRFNSSNYLNQITFQLNLKKLDPDYISRNIEKFM